MCEKRRFLGRREAKRFLRLYEGRGVVRPGMHVYQCSRCPWWHVGHMPSTVKRGFLARAEIR